VAQKTVVASIARTDGKTFTLRNAQIETSPLDFGSDNKARLDVEGRAEPYRLSWIVNGDPGEYQVQITAPPESVDEDANKRKRTIDIDGAGAGMRTFSVAP